MGRHKWKRRSMDRTGHGGEYSILEHVKLAELQDSEPHIDGFDDCDSNFLEIEAHQQLVEDADILALWLA